LLQEGLVMALNGVCVPLAAATRAGEAGSGLVELIEQLPLTVTFQVHEVESRPSEIKAEITFGPI
jgi:hypothetical protein